MKNSKLILFESTQANFRLSIDTMYEKVKQDGTTQSTIYINQQKEQGTFRPSCFLVFTYLTDDFNTTKGVYTTVPHMPRIREAFDLMHQYLHDPNAYIEIEGQTAVAPAYSEPIVIDNLSLKNNDWISLVLSSYKDSISSTTRFGVALQHSKSNGYSSMLTSDEFDAIYDLIMHMDYVSLENQAVIIELLSRVGIKSNQVQTPVTYNTTAPQASYTRQSQPPVRGSVPRSNVTPAYQQPAPAAPTPAVTPVSTNTRPVASVQQANSPLPPRQASTAPKITMDAVKDIEIEDMNLDDSEQVSAIFNDEE